MHVVVEYFNQLCETIGDTIHRTVQLARDLIDAREVLLPVEHVLTERLRLTRTASRTVKSEHVVERRNRCLEVRKVRVRERRARFAPYAIFRRETLSDKNETGFVGDLVDQLLRKSVRIDVHLSISNLHEVV